MRELPWYPAAAGPPDPSLVGLVRRIAGLVPELAAAPDRIGPGPAAVLGQIDPVRIAGQQLADQVERLRRFRLDTRGQHIVAPGGRIAARKPVHIALVLPLAVRRERRMQTPGQS